VSILASEIQEADFRSQDKQPSGELGSSYGLFCIPTIRLHIAIAPQRRRFWLAVELVWIELTAPSYGIQGTSTPEHIAKTESRGCIRLTNWDALVLDSMVSRGTVVDFQR
jgi:hypothetical protein